MAQDRFQNGVAADLERIITAKKVDKEILEALTLFLNVAAASSDEPVRLAERLRLADSELRDDSRVSTLNLRKAIKLGNAVIQNNLKI